MGAAKPVRSGHRPRPTGWAVHANSILEYLENVPELLKPTFVRNLGHRHFRLFQQHGQHASDARSG